MHFQVRQMPRTVEVGLDKLDKTAKKIPPEQNSNHTPKQEVLIHKVMQRALVNFIELANSSSSYSASLSE